ncbi:cyclin-dependent kinase E-1-like isoform X2 [Zingiber officinale]|uniref:cyclin-dependent kinase E-1-like isoform X2 n=1 Tax=Zingiber officinale TaxID=94328 RepID=UPI001C4D9D7F|nr:cyclin-dependent kinase E-1-like isoform X2 [Zingiber officinale]
MFLFFCQQFRIVVFYQYPNLTVILLHIIISETILFGRYDPRKRITAAQALEHEYFRMDPLPGRNALVPSQPGEKTVNYPARPVDQTADFEGTVPVQPSQPVSSANAASGNVAASVGPSRSMPRPIHMVGMQRMPNANMTSFNVASQAGIAPPNSGGLPLQRGGAGAHGHQQQLRRKDPGMGMQNPNYPQQKRRF